LTCADYERGDAKIPGLSVSASKDRAGTIHVTLCNLNPNSDADVTCDLQGAKAKSISGRVLTGPEITTHNTFEKPETIQPAEFRGFKPTDGGFSVTLPAKSVVVLAIE
jgi:alpha-N-arabinofuranosidase